METSPSRLGDLILLRLCAAGQPPSGAVLAQSLEPYFVARLSLKEDQWRRVISDALKESVDAGAISRSEYRLTAVGTRVCRKAFQLTELPKDRRWIWLRNRPLIASALGVQPQSSGEWEKLATADGLRAAILVNTFHLQLSSFCSLAEVVRDESVRDVALRELSNPHDFTELKTRLPAIAIGVQDQSVESLRRAVVNNWLDQCDQEARRKSGDVLTDRVPFVLEEFAEQLQTLANRTSMEKFGGNKVFLSHLWNSYASQGQTGISRPEFDRHLLEANRLNLVTLSRADLISAMNVQDVEESEISLPHATFHFLRTDTRPAEDPAA